MKSLLPILPAILVAAGFYYPEFSGVSFALAAMAAWVCIRRR